MTKFEAYVTREIGEFIWNGFCDPTGVGVRLADILEGATLVGVNLTDAQKTSVLAHIDDPDEWTDDDESTRDAIADATDIMSYEPMHDWLAFIVGDTTAADLAKAWEDEAQSIVDHFDRVNYCHTMTAGEWKNAFKEELKEATDDDERDAIKAAADLLDNEDNSALAICYEATDPIDFTILPYEASTQAEKRLCRELAL